MNLHCKNNASINIRPITMEDFSCILKWSKDNAFCSANDWDQNRDEQELYKWWQYCVSKVSEDFIRLGIELEHKLIGYADLAYIKGNSAELGVAIGESSLWGRGVGYNSSISIMNYAAEHLDISIFNAETHETNHRAIKMLERLRFKEISRIGCEEYLGVETKLIQYQFLL